MHYLMLPVGATVAIISALVLTAWLGERLSHNNTIKHICNTGWGIFAGTCLSGLGFLAAVAGAASTPSRLGLTALGMLFFTFFISVGIFSEQTTPPTKRSRSTT